jgi:hypothetical protein
MKLPVTTADPERRAGGHGYTISHDLIEHVSVEQHATAHL